MAVTAPPPPTKQVRLIKSGLEVPFSIKVKIDGELYDAEIVGVRRIHNSREWDRFYNSPEYEALAASKTTRHVVDAVFHAGTSTRPGTIKSWNVLALKDKETDPDTIAPITADSILALPDEVRLELYRELSKPYADELAKKPASSSS